jgi:hypothetical protein
MYSDRPMRSEMAHQSSQTLNTNTLKITTDMVLICSIIMNPNVHYVPLDPVLSHVNPLHATSHYYFKIHFNVILPPTPIYIYVYSKCLFPSRFPRKILHAFLFCPTRHMPHPFYPPWFDQATWLKDNTVPVHTIEAYRGSRGTAPLILTLGTRWWVISFTPLTLYPLRK